MSKTERSLSRWGQFARDFATWRRRMRSRDELSGMSDAGLQDIGLTRCDAAHKWSEAFWMN